MAAEAEAFVAAAGRALAAPDDRSLTDDDLAQVMSAAVKVYAARAEASGQFPPPVLKERVSATEALIALCEIIRTVDVNIFEVSMWLGRAEMR